VLFGWFAVIPLLENKSENVNMTTAIGTFPIIGYLMVMFPANQNNINFYTHSVAPLGIAITIQLAFIVLKNKSKPADE
jgi:hypothetical protein